MQLTRFTDLGLRAMMLLSAGEFDDQRVTTRHIAASAGASENHIAKAVSRLVELGLVEARRGRVGGLSLT
ncbi:transcriptional regulator, partial [Mycobacterium sp. ITM-2017-0098]